MKKISLFLSVVLVFCMVIPLVSCESSKLEFALVSGTDGYCVVSRGNNKDTEIVVPETYRGKSVIAINTDAFRGQTDIVKVTLPDSIETIGINAFEGCSSLANINTPSSLKEIGSGAFRGCKALKSFTLPDTLTYISRNAFDENFPLYTVENGATYFDNWLIKVDTDVKELKLKEGTVGLADCALRESFVPRTVDVVWLPKTIKVIEIPADLAGTTFHYDGTMAEFQQIWKKAQFYYVSVKIHCTDGIINGGLGN